MSNIERNDTRHIYKQYILLKLHWKREIKRVGDSRTYNETPPQKQINYVNVEETNMLEIRKNHKKVLNDNKITLANGE